ncbi:MAG: M23 family metallopeptidase [Bacteroidetes bacterium]|nr:M23 family metallopeptidase [Bacteroidota bacterium]
MYTLHILLIATYFSFKTAWNKSFFISFRFKECLLLLFILVLTGIYGANAYTVLKGFVFTEKPIELVFPLKKGSYYVSHGGNCVFLNHHQSYAPQKYALDIVKLNRFGVRAKGILLKELSKYEIYADTIFSPCDGEVIKAVGDEPDMTPTELNQKKPLGNYVAIKTNGIVVYLAHMMKGSLSVKQGDLVKVGQVLGKVGNSGKSSQPHLHIHAEKISQGIPMKFNDKFLFRNSVI